MQVERSGALKFFTAKVLQFVHKETLMALSPSWSNYNTLAVRTPVYDASPTSSLHLKGVSYEVLRYYAWHGRRSGRPSQVRVSAQAQIDGNRDKKVNNVSNPPKAPTASSPAPLSPPSKSDETPAQTQEDVSIDKRAADSTAERGDETKQAIDSIGAELAKIRQDRGSTELVSKSGFWAGVLEETRMIEWPAFSNVLGTTGVVVGIIVGSSVILLTLNALLASLSDQLLATPVFAEFWRI